LEQHLAAVRDVQAQPHLNLSALKSVFKLLGPHEKSYGISDQMHIVRPFIRRYENNGQLTEVESSTVCRILKRIEECLHEKQQEFLQTLAETQNTVSLDVAQTPNTAPTASPAISIPNKTTTTATPSPLEDQLRSFVMDFASYVNHVENTLSQPSNSIDEQAYRRLARDLQLLASSLTTGADSLNSLRPPLAQLGTSIFIRLIHQHNEVKNEIRKASEQRGRVERAETACRNAQDDAYKSRSERDEFKTELSAAQLAVQKAQSECGQLKRDMKSAQERLDLDPVTAFKAGIYPPKLRPTLEALAEIIERLDQNDVAWLTSKDNLDELATGVYQIYASGGALRAAGVEDAEVFSYALARKQAETHDRLRDLGIRPILPVPGDRYDPKYHLSDESTFVYVTDTRGDNHVHSVLAMGFELQGTTHRHAIVRRCVYFGNSMTSGVDSAAAHFAPAIASTDSIEQSPVEIIALSDTFPEQPDSSSQSTVELTPLPIAAHTEKDNVDLVDETGHPPSKHIVEQGAEIALTSTDTSTYVDSHLVTPILLAAEKTTLSPLAKEEIPVVDPGLVSGMKKTERIEPLEEGGKGDTDAKIPTASEFEDQLAALLDTATGNTNNHGPATFNSQ